MAVRIVTAANNEKKQCQQRMRKKISLARAIHIYANGEKLFSGKMHICVKRDFLGRNAHILLPLSKRFGIQNTPHMETQFKQNIALVAVAALALAVAFSLASCGIISLY